jgi:hypothetical protein
MEANLLNKNLELVTKTWMWELCLLSSSGAHYVWPCQNVFHIQV